ncbi:MAG TPA: CFI-box-CTERM domain-containing protein [Nitrososphaera sp.]|nr:CFI-box-CTERM domain-containing protein [Nitrososphaera sp.]
MPKAPILASLLILILCFSTVTLFSPSFAQSGQKGPYIEEARFIHRADEVIALEEVKNGALDMYHFRIPLEAAPDAERDPRLKVYDRNAGSMGFFVNPAPSADGSTINPFESREARHALNFLIDRDFMVNDILRGYGSPMIDAFGLYSAEYLNIIDVVESFGIRYNPALAESIISREMTEMGAVKSDDKWTFNSNPVTVVIVIRQDDAPRKSMGELMASELEKIGFTVQRDFGDLNKANAVVYGSDPKELQWHLYTEGFAGTSAFVKYNPVVPAQMYAPWYTRMPGGENPDFWNYENATLDRVTEDILFFNFASEQERNELVRSAVQMGIQESVRLFAAQKTDPYVASAQLEGLVNDFGAGITSKYALANARHSSGETSLDIGVKQIHQGSWNSIAGLQDAYSRDIFHSVSDSGTFRDPYTGVVIPMRGEWTDVSTAGPAGELDVDPQAIVWDPASQSWKNVEPGTQSKSSVTFTPLYSNWHHGIPMDSSDFLYAEYFTYEWGTNSGTADMTFDAEYTSQAEVALEYLKGVKISEDEITNYVDVWHYDETEIADTGVFWVTEPWELTAAAERVVMDGKLSFSRTEATSRGVSWYDPLVRDHASIISDELEAMKDEGYVPPALRDTVTTEDASRRYDAAIQWIASHGHAVISNGGFYLDNYNTAGGTITIKAFRDPTYPFETGHWSGFQEPQLADINRVNAPRTVTIGQPVTATVDVTVAGVPSSDAEVSYFVSGRDGSLVTKGRAEPVSTGQFQFELPAEETQKFSPGPNQLKVFATGTKAVRYDVLSTPIVATTTDQQSPDPTPNSTSNGTPPPDQPSGCLIATAAFGSELSPQVQYLRNFREQYILSTAAGSAFMSTFNAAYYSFSPQVADYEREQPWLQSAVRTGLYPLFGVLMLSEKAHFATGGGEAGALASGTVAGLLIGAIYLWPTTFSARVQSRYGAATKIMVMILAGGLTLTVVGLAAGSPHLLSASTPIFVVALAGTAALSVGRLARAALKKISDIKL